MVLSTTLLIIILVVLLTAPVITGVTSLVVGYVVAERKYVRALKEQEQHHREVYKALFDNMAPTDGEPMFVIGEDDGEGPLH